jgi:CheY-like chemotaxis protein
MYTVLLIDDNEANQLVAQKNINTIKKDVDVVLQSSYQEALAWLNENDLPDSIIANSHIWSSTNNIFTFIDGLKQTIGSSYLPLFVSSLSLSQKQQMQLLDYHNMVCLLEMPVTLVDAAIVVNHLQKRNFINSMLFAS